MTTATHHRLASQLIDIECAMRNAGLWSTEAPSAEALASVEPFCVDTMDFQQWLQFVFLPRMSALLAAGNALPARCEIATMGETVWTNNKTAMQVIHALRNFDQMINGE